MKRAVLWAVELALPIVAAVLTALLFTRLPPATAGNTFVYVLAACLIAGGLTKAGLALLWAVWPDDEQDSDR